MQYLILESVDTKKASNELTLLAFIRLQLSHIHLNESISITIINI